MSEILLGFESGVLIPGLPHSLFFESDIEEVRERFRKSESRLILVKRVEQGIRGLRPKATGHPMQHGFAPFEPLGPKLAGDVHVNVPSLRQILSADGRNLRIRAPTRNNADSGVTSFALV